MTSLVTAASRPISRRLTVGSYVKSTAWKGYRFPASHDTDLRKAPGTVTRELIGARYGCDHCHVPQTDAKPFVVITYAE